jgi:alpha-glucan,water dikinase
MSHLESANTQPTTVKKAEQPAPHVVDVRERPENLIEIELVLAADEPALLHWGVTALGAAAWQVPDAQLWPAESRPAGAGAVESVIVKDRGEGRVTLRVPRGFEALCYAVRYPRSGRWDNRKGRNYRVELPSPAAPVRKARAELPALAPGDRTFERVYGLEEGASMRAAIERKGEGRVLSLVTNLEGPLLLHWGTNSRPSAPWKAPPASWLPAGSEAAGEAAARTPFEERDGVMQLELPLDFSNQTPALISAVLFRPRSGTWIKDGGRDFRFPVREESGDPGDVPGSALVNRLAARIIDEELNASSWTLMHRFELATELLDEAAEELGAIALIYTWLRYSAIRQLDWQRRYNTQPRRLTHAQDRLSRRMAALWRDRPDARPWVLLLLGTVGRGGNGQRVRDDILAIMHKHHIKEVSGTFVEQWHQKLHNNTTPDDIAICEAFIAFLRSRGDQDTFYSTLELGGVSRERLKSYDRAITVEPELPAADLGSLAHDFEHYLALLRAVHGSGDLASALDPVRDRLPGGVRERIERLLHAQREQPASSGSASADGAALRRSEHLAWAAEGRRMLAEELRQTQDEGLLRDLLYLDLALLDHVRSLVESTRGKPNGLPALARDVESVLASLLTADDHAELRACEAHWRKLDRLAGEVPREVALEARSVVERISRWVGQTSAELVQRLDPIGKALGKAFHAESWAVNTFSEEVVRGGPLFALGVLLGETDTLLRASAGLGPWQVVSPGEGQGQAVVVERLLDVQGRTLSSSVVFAAHVGGEEEIPCGAVAVITPCPVDLLCHLAVRARNSGVLLATVWDPELWASLTARAGQWLALTTNAAGEIDIAEGQRDHAKSTTPVAGGATVLRRPRAELGVLSPGDFAADRVGGKSRVLAELRAAIPQDLRIPPSMALAFGSFERVLEDARNQPVRETLQRLESELAALEADAQGERAGQKLAELRAAVLELVAPPELQRELARVAGTEGLALMADFGAAWRAICTVWASKWTDRAHFARRSRAIPAADVFMAVLIQAVVPADYAFVLHTTNPLGKDPNELYGELVMGMGEALVGNYPGRALGFVAKKGSAEPAQVLAYPSKSTVLRASGLIFRSDSNAEDLEGFAGAGLHDSVTAAPMQRQLADYADEPLVQDSAFRADLLARLVRAGEAIERARGAPQDIEGAIAGGVVHIVQSRPQVGL